MSRMVKTFKVVEPDETPEPYPFEFELVPKHDDPIVDLIGTENGVRHLNENGNIIERFEAMGTPPAGAQLALAGIIRYGSRGKQNIDMNSMMDFFARVMSDEDYERMRNLFDDKRWIIPIDAVGEVFEWLTEEYNDRPTKRSRRSTHMRPVGGRTERDAVIELPDDSVAETSST